MSLRQQSTMSQPSYPSSCLRSSLAQLTCIFSCRYVAKFGAARSVCLLLLSNMSVMLRSSMLVPVQRLELSFENSGIQLNA